MEAIGSIFNRIVRDFGLENARKINVIRKKWPDLVGEIIATHTYPDFLRRDILTLIVESPHWMHHLTFYKNEIITRLERFGIREVNFRIGKLPPSADEKTRPLERPLSEDDRRYLNEILRDIRDEELRQRFGRLLFHGLSMGRRQ